MFKSFYFFSEQTSKITHVDNFCLLYCVMCNFIQGYLKFDRKTAVNKFTFFSIVSTWKFDYQFKDLPTVLLNWNNNIDEDRLAPLLRVI